MVSHQVSEELPLPAEEIPPALESQRRQADTPLQLADVVTSIHASYPLVEAAYQEWGIAAGSQLAAAGGFDTKFKAASENGPLGFYQTYRHSVGVSQPLYSGGEAFAGYRIGRGEFQPWYLERQTNDGGEFKAGLSVPLLRNREIDERRANLWRATYDRQLADPAIREQLILYVQDGSVVFWEWIAAGLKYQIGESALQLALQRNEQLKRKVELGDIEPPELQDNLRAIAQRENKLIDLRRKLGQSAVKLSLFYRNENGNPVVPDDSQIADFPTPLPVTTEQLEQDMELALRQRPELIALDTLTQRANVDLAEAQNDLLPTVDAQLIGSQDVGGPTSSKRDKSPFELEASVFVNVPLQRRKAQGKIQSTQAKLIQIAAKRRFTEDKIQAELQAAFVALSAAYDRLGKAAESRRLASYMAEVEQRKLELGESDILKLALREQYAIEAADAEVDAHLEYFLARARYHAAMALDRPLEQTPPE